ncbi:hypothetical protein BS50DRAFT_651739 [Corynespora cassiicola Philippines]|uniref:Uncharacterized protein n=1 Tax=Corynespora cassiicola Philippines TaxID=1448308 RepID=A0A2T2N7V2_CORCC|nr:hypothetical protein BS50DRAFT_651739 [Corynespora cassiicola Philippines]
MKKRSRVNEDDNDAATRSCNYNRGVGAIQGKGALRTTIRNLERKVADLEQVNTDRALGHARTVQRLKTDAEDAEEEILQLKNRIAQLDMSIYLIQSCIRVLSDKVLKFILSDSHTVIKIIDGDEMTEKGLLRIAEPDRYSMIEKIISCLEKEIQDFFMFEGTEPLVNIQKLIEEYIVKQRVNIEQLRTANAMMNNKYHGKVISGNLPRFEGEEKGKAHPLRLTNDRKPTSRVPQLAQLCPRETSMIRTDGCKDSKCEAIYMNQLGKYLRTHMWRGGLTIEEKAARKAYDDEKKQVMKEFLKTG